MCELGSHCLPLGAVRRIQVLGAFCVADQRETDWKIMGVADSIPESTTSVTYVEELRKQHEGKMLEIMHWFRMYKTYEGDKDKTILFASKLFGVDETLAIIQDAHVAYNNLRAGNTRIKGSFWLGL